MKKTWKSIALLAGLAAAATGANAQETDTCRMAQPDTLAVAEGQDTIVPRPEWFIDWDRMQHLPQMDFSVKPQPEQRYYFSFYDIQRVPMPARVSNFTSPIDRSGREDFRYLWSGRMTPFVERGFPAGYYRGDSRATQIFLIRDKGKIVGIGYRTLEP